MNREELPFRKNCEGYLIFGDGQIIARECEDYIEFPGGGVEDNETPKEALKREAFEEAGIVIQGELEEIKILEFLWDDSWAKTDKQKQRYEKFKGEEMHFFVGKAKEILPGRYEWKGKVKMEIDEVLRIINKSRPFSADIKEYREFQISVLESLKDKKFN